MDAIINVIEDWSRAKDEQLSTHAIFFDFAKAFDLVDHKVLLEKLSKNAPGVAYLMARRLLNRPPTKSKSRDNIN